MAALRINHQQNSHVKAGGRLKRGYGEVANPILPQRRHCLRCLHFAKCSIEAIDRPLVNSDLHGLNGFVHHWCWGVVELPGVDAPPGGTHLGHFECIILHPKNLMHFIGKQYHSYKNLAPKSESCMRYIYAARGSCHSARLLRGNVT